MAPPLPQAACWSHCALQTMGMAVPLTVCLAPIPRLPGCHLLAALALNPVPPGCHSPRLPLPTAMHLTLLLEQAPSC